MTTITITVQIGNSDNKLSQGEWSHFCHYTADTIEAHAERVHFAGFSHPADPWQNAAWVFVPYTHDDKLEELKRELSYICTSFKQDSIAWTEGETEFVTPYKD